jgi:hypothetical protein
MCIWLWATSLLKKYDAWLEFVRAMHALHASRPNYSLFQVEEIASQCLTGDAGSYKGRADRYLFVDGNDRFEGVLIAEFPQPVRTQTRCHCS